MDNQQTSLSPSQWTRAKAIFHTVADCPPGERSAIIGDACQDDAAVRALVESLLASDAASSSFMEESAATRFGVAVSEPLAPGRRVGPYEIIGAIGAGGMGEVYRARDTRLGRDVALKILPTGFLSDPTRRAWFEREARAAAAIEHPHICPVYDVGEHEGWVWIAMQYVDGETLASRLSRGPLTLDASLVIAEQIVDALGAAHARGIVHRDVKPENVMLDTGGQVKVLDFGLAEFVGDRQASDTPAPPPAVDAATIEARQAGGRPIRLGTLLYMAPEQVRGAPVDSRTDVFSFGAVLFEMLTGRRAFEGSTTGEITDAVLRLEPVSVSTIVPAAPPALVQLIRRSVAKAPEARYQSMQELADELRGIQAGLQRARRWRQLRWRLAVAAGVMILVGAGAIAWMDARRARLERAETALHDATRLANDGNYLDAVLRATDAERLVPMDPRLAPLWNRIAVSPAIESDPSGAEVFIQALDRADSAWTSLGRTPVTTPRVPHGLLRWRVRKEGFGTRDFVDGADSMTDVVRLLPNDRVPRDMTLVQHDPRKRLRLWNYLGGLPTPADDYLIDRYEVTNDQFMTFVRAGGYTTPRYWTERFVTPQGELAWGTAVQQFVDRTGHAGPATWAHGRYPPGQEHFPVGGLSWFEAAAYAEFAGKRLPTVYHWLFAAGCCTGYIPVGNQGGTGVAPVGQSSVLSGGGAYDMAGNVREWTWNAGRPGTRFILGGAWDEPDYAFTHPSMVSAFDRSSSNGARLMRLLEKTPLREAMLQPLRTVPLRPLKEPVSDEVFETLRHAYAYDPRPLDAAVETTVTSEQGWTRQRVSFAATYGDERVTGYLYLPRAARPPYQTIIYWPGASAVDLATDDTLETRETELLLLHGRAVFYPIYKGTYSRRLPVNMLFDRHTRAYRDWYVEMMSDLRRSVDYLQTRGDIDPERLSYFGFSWGGVVGPIALALEPRLRAGVLVAGGIQRFFEPPPEVDAMNFAPRVTAPVLMINGALDPIMPVEESQKPIFAALGPPGARKRLVVLPAGHGLLLQHRARVTQEMEGWLDTYLGPVHRQ